MTQPYPDYATPAVAAVFAAFSDGNRRALLHVRQMIFATADTLPDVGPITETLKWGQPSYLTDVSKSGTTIRLGVAKTGGVGIYTHCQTTVMSDLQALVGEGFVFDGNRGLLLNTGAELPEPELRLLISSALTYHRKS